MRSGVVSGMIDKLRHASVKNFMFLTFYNIFLIAVSFITIPYLMRVIGPDRYGLLAFAMAFIQYFTFFLDYGFNFSSVREISINRRDAAKVSSIFSAVMALRLLFMAAIFILVAGVCMLVPRFRPDWQVYIYTFSWLAGYGLFPAFLFMGMERMNMIFYFGSFNVIFTLLVFAAVKSAADFIFVPILSGLGSLISALAALWFIRKEMRVVWSLPDLHQLTHELREGSRMFLSNLVAVGHSNIRIFLVGMLWGNAVTGYYSVAERIMNMMILLPLGLSTQAVYPRLCHIYAADKERVRRLIGRLQRMTNISYLIFCGAAYLYAPALITWMCGTPSAIAIVSFRLLLFSVFITAINAFYIQWFLAAGLMNIVSRIAVVTGLIGTVLAYPLIRTYSYRGAAYSIMIILILAFCMTWVYRKKVFGAHKEIYEPS